jgi:3-hydroxyacyl-CoA dehydrogenase/enoyl-CoA hydratase/3-hydroxybutyryl-CoA epimerase
MPLFESKSVVVERDTDGTLMLRIDVPDRGVNVLNAQLLADLDAACDRLASERTAPLLMVRSGKPTGFIAGADLHEFLAIGSAAEAEAVSERGQKLFDKLAALPMPTVAAVHGPCLGGGLELALACDYRLVFDRANTQLGLPEVELGLLPGWGGTQRLPRVVGMERALQMILGGRRLDAREALKWGLADVTAAGERELRGQIVHITAVAVKNGKRPRTKLPLHTWRQWFLESNRLGRRLLLRGTERLLRKRVWDDMPAPWEALEAVRTGVREGVIAGLKREREAAGRLAVSAPCRNLIGLFFRREQARKCGEKPPEVHRVGVVGAGVMGAGIAQLAALQGFHVIVQEANEEALGAAISRIAELFAKAVERRLLSGEEARKRLSGVRGTLTWEGFGALDVVVEAATEDADAKRAIFRELDERTKPEAVLATNTSSLSVARLQEGLRLPGRVAGMHFFNPVHKVPLVEVARAATTDPAAVELLRQWSIVLGKTPVVVRDSPGFVVNRVLMPYLNEALLLVAEGLRIASVDATMRRFGMPMGPLEILDQIGLDVAAHVASAMHPVLGGRFEASAAFEKMRGNGWLGQKSGRGFYWHSKKSATPNALAENLLRAGAAPDVVGRALGPEARHTEARERLVLLMVNEAAMLLSEGVADSAETIDLAMVLGTGWAPHRGGPLRYADERGLSGVVEALSGLAARRGKRFEPCAELKARAAERRPFTEPSRAV